MKTGLIFKSFALLIAVSIVYFVFAGAAGGTNNTMNKASTCNKTVCVTDLNGNPVVNHSIHIYDRGGNDVGNCTTGSSGCCTFAYEFTDGAQYKLCDVTADCPNPTSNCKYFTIFCGTPGLEMHDCGN